MTTVGEEKRERERSMSFLLRTTLFRYHHLRQGQLFDVVLRIFKTLILNSLKSQFNFAMPLKITQSFRRHLVSHV